MIKENFNEKLKYSLLMVIIPLMLIVSYKFIVTKLISVENYIGGRNVIVQLSSKFPNETTEYQLSLNLKTNHCDILDTGKWVKPRYSVNDVWQSTSPYPFRYDYFMVDIFEIKDLKLFVEKYCKNTTINSNFNLEIYE